MVAIRRGARQGIGWDVTGVYQDVSHRPGEVANFPQRDFLGVWAPTSTVPAFIRPIVMPAHE